MENVNVFVPKIPKLYKCDTCYIYTSNKKDYNKHISTTKHQKLILINHELIKESPKHICSDCLKEYKSYVGLWKHKKVCLFVNKYQEINNEVSEKNMTEDKDKMIELLIKENEDFKNIILEFMKNSSDIQKQMIDVCKNTNITNMNINNSNSNNNNKTFNLQFFLNEQCKDAMNISDFANSFELELSDLESVGDLGYVEGITKIFLDKLNSMDIYKRPIHCSDAKRETLYVKDDNKWEKEERNNPKIRYAIKTISFRNMKLAVLWSETYPESKDCDSHVNERYMKLIKESTGGSGEIIDNENKIIRRIAKEILIDKK